MIAICKTNDAFEDSLLAGKEYQVKELRNGSVLIDSEAGPRWFGVGRFEIRAAQ